jgi:hypothetical protein
MPDARGEPVAGRFTAGKVSPLLGSASLPTDCRWHLCLVTGARHPDHIRSESFYEVLTVHSASEIQLLPGTAF